MKNLLLGLALVAGASACSSQKNSVSDAAPATGAKVECKEACEAGKSECCDEKAKAACEGEAKVCPMSGKVQG
ncbi:MAG: hypothetical protein IPK67_01855 [Planctomycetes bacterium]|jgi:hypothetical protein|nr:hypothetical protein [Planctomycetota bacterium]